MKQQLLKSIICIVFATGFKSSYAQNSLELKSGYWVPVNSQLNKAFTGSQAFSIALLHPLKSVRFEVGLQYSRQQFQSNNQFFTDNYSSNFHVHNCSVTGKYYFIRREEFNISVDADLGISRINLRETKNANNYTKEKIGLTTAVSAGAALKLSHRLMLCAGAKSMICLADNLNFEDKIFDNKIISVGGNIGLKLLLRKEKNM